MDHIIDLRSDTITKPTEQMKDAMICCPLGDDVYGEDPTVNSLESKLCSLIGKEAALFVPTASMANLIAVMVHCSKRGSEVILGKSSHIFKYEQGSIGHIGGVLTNPIINNADGTFNLDEVEKGIRGSDIHEPVTSLVCVENTHNYCGGKVLPPKWLDDLAILCTKHSIPIHMDGARLFNACEYLKMEPSLVTKDCSSVSLCFSKGLSAPIGAALVGSAEFVAKARRLRKMLGGGMRQAGVLAATAIVGLEEVVPNLHHDHKRASTLAKAINDLSLTSFVVNLEEQQTNIVIITIVSVTITADQVIEALSTADVENEIKGSKDKAVIVKISCFDQKRLRMVLHREITDFDLKTAIHKITSVFIKLDAFYRV